MSAPMNLARERYFAPSQLTGGQLALLRSELTDALMKHLAQFEESTALATSLTADGTDDDTGSDREMARHAAERARDALTDVERALERFDDGTYGTCESCGRPIPFERLEAVPHARYCFTCSRRGGLAR